MIEPGARLAGRYRLDELVSETSGAALWKATDETLARQVGVWTFADGFGRTDEVVRAARAASRIADARVTQVFDADDSGPTTYVVQEWISGQSLSDLLRNGPLEPERAAGLVAEAAEAVTAAAAAGIHHLCLTPGKLIWSSGGAVKVTGVGVDAALQGISSGDPAVVDAQGLGRLLYAALTAHWPGPEQTSLRPAPIVSGRPCEPSQIRAGIPTRLNEIVCRAAFQASGREGPLRTAQDVADTLADVPRMVPLPLAEAAPAPQPVRGTSRTSGQLGMATENDLLPPRPPRRRAAPPPPPPTSLTNKILMGAVALLVFVAVVMGAWVVGANMSGGTGGTDVENASVPEEDEETELQVITPASATGFDPPPGDSDEHNDKASLAIDGDPSSSWNTQGYNSAEFGNLKSGVGLLVDMGAEVELHEIDITFGSGAHNASVYVRGDAGGVPGEGEQPQWQGSGVSGEVPVKLDQPVTGRYVVVWFSAPLPQDDGSYRGVINEVELRGIQ
ncbi:protein kinase family protein [Actinorugispora endophytica]|uniref:Protein kinase domain-containing protein n=1 Tax=Actinorugispora endophytica TaxID=1605990 RepID=A0A4R6V510_9ACTN|nr:protein kinase family protein [Actinorugispora endophytica]TDQ55525.1 hypothetical protein EV190_101856 [Actinorugispora endophytica]